MTRNDRKSFQEQEKGIIQLASNKIVYASPETPFTRVQRREYAAFIQHCSLKLGQHLGLDQSEGIILREIGIASSMGSPTNVAKIVANTGYPQQTVSRKVHELIERGWVMEKPGRGRSKNLWFHPDRAVAAAEFVNAQMELMLELAEKIKREREANTKNIVYG
jgi:DNA-binding MarR family transcriptional regulator